MTCYCPELYYDFICLADRCPSTCCAGWKIVVDGVAKRRFEKLDREELRQDIMGHLQEKDGEYRFENGPDGRCTMLDADGLCRIQKQLGEKALCNTCRKFPRLTARVGDDFWLSMAASCPVVAGYLWNQKPIWIAQGENGEKCRVDICVFPPVMEGMTLYGKYVQAVKGKRQHSYSEESGEHVLKVARQNWYRYGLFLDLVDGCLGLMEKFPQWKYLEGSLSYFEEDKAVAEILQDMEAFALDWQSPIMAFVENYLPYRFFSRFLEFQEEASLRRFCQVMGELALIYLILFSRYHTLGLTEKNIIETINWVYRFCVHGAALAEKVTELFWKLYETPEDFICLFLY